MPTEEEQRAFSSAIYYHGTRYVPPGVARTQGLKPGKNGKLYITRHDFVAEGYAALGRDKDDPTAWKPNSKGWVYAFPKPKNLMGSEKKVNKKGARALGLYTTETVHPTHAARAWIIPLKTKGGYTTDTPRGPRRYTSDKVYKRL